jgi:hypothetical protein
MREAIVPVVIAFAFAGIGCGRSPATPPRTPVKMMHAPDGHLVPVPTDDDDEDGDLIPVEPRQSRQVEYVPMQEWQAPNSVQTFEAQVVPRGNVSPSYTQFPKLTLHRPIPETRVLGRYHY